MMDYTEQSTDPKHAYNSEPGFVQIHTSEKVRSLREIVLQGHTGSVDPCFVSKERMRKVTDEQEFCDRDTRVMRLRKAARQCWAK